MLNYILVLQLITFGLQKHKSGWGVKIPRPRYFDPHPVFLTDCAINYQDRLVNANT